MKNESEDTAVPVPQEIELIIQKVVGIKPGAKNLTPMDYGECKLCMQALIERKEAETWNKAIEACIHRAVDLNDNGMFYIDSLMTELKELKK